jgi:hypothetical protein
MLCDQLLPQMGPLTPKKVVRIAQHVRKEGGRNEGKYGVRSYINIYRHVLSKF